LANIFEWNDIPIHIEKVAKTLATSYSGQMSNEIGVLILGLFHASLWIGEEMMICGHDFWFVGVVVMKKLIFKA
jgi:hypothetical protein